MTKVQILSRRGAESIFEGDNGLYLVQLTPQFNLPGLQGLLFSSITRILHLWRITAMVRRKPVPVVFPPFAHFLLNLILIYFRYNNNRYDESCSELVLFWQNKRGFGLCIQPVSQSPRRQIGELALQRERLGATTKGVAELYLHTLCAKRQVRGRGQKESRRSLSLHQILPHKLKTTLHTEKRLQHHPSIIIYLRSLLSNLIKPK